LKAENLFSKALEADPKFAKAIVGKAEVFWNKHSYMNRENILDTVLTMADLAISYDDKIAEAYVIKGWCYDDYGMYDKALKEYSKAIELNPNNWKAYYGLANLYYFEDPVISLENLHKAVSLMHGSTEMPTLLRYIGGELLVTGFIEKAGEYFSRAFDLDGDSAIYLSCLGGIEQNQGNYDKALEYYKKAYLIKRNYTDVLNNLALISQLIGNNDESLEWYKELKLQNTLNFNLHRAGYAYKKNGLENEGDSLINKHIEYCNSMLTTGRRSDIISYTYYDLSGVYAFRGDKKKAYQNLRMFSKVENCYLYMLTLMKDDPMFSSIRTEPEFLQILNVMTAKYAKVHEDVGKWLAKQEGN
jgi:tetratricopeptide (TPR) repeat protein